MPDQLDQISDDEMELIMTRSKALSTKALTAKTVTPPPVPLTRANGDSDSGKPVSEPSYEVMDTAEEDATEQTTADTSATDGSLATRSSADQEPATPPRRGRAPPRTKRPSSSSRSTRKESSTRTIVRKPGYKSQHYKYSIPKHSHFYR